MQNLEAIRKNSAVNAKAVTRYVRVSPRKVRLLLDMIRKQPVQKAFLILQGTRKKSARLVSKTLKSALANARDKKMDETKLFVRLAFADGGPSMKRFLPRAMGRADQILKRSSHITVVLEEGKVNSSESGLPPTEDKAGMKKKLFSKKMGKQKEKAQAAA